MKKGQIKPTLQLKVEEDKRKRERVKDHYGIDDENVVVVEKSNTVKFILKFIAKFLRIMINVMIFIFAFLGFFCALTALLIFWFAPDVLQNVWTELHSIIQIYF